MFTFSFQIFSFFFHCGQSESHKYRRPIRDPDVAVFFVFYYRYRLFQSFKCNNKFYRLFSTLSNKDFFCHSGWRYGARPSSILTCRFGINLQAPNPSLMGNPSHSSKKTIITTNGAKVNPHCILLSAQKSLARA